MERHQVGGGGSARAEPGQRGGAAAAGRDDPDLPVQADAHRGAAGSKVTFTNQDDITHTVTSGTPESRDGKFSHQLTGKGATATVELTLPGVYPYFCERHRSMRGEIHVK